MGAPRVDLQFHIGEDLQVDMEVIDQASTVDPATGAPVPPAQWVPLDIVTGYTFRFDLRREPTSADPPLIAVDCTIVGAYNASRVLNTQRARAAISDADSNGTGPANLGAGGGLFWYSFKRTNDGAERIALYGQARAIRATQA